MLMASTISVASVTNQDFGMASAEFVKEKLVKLEKDRQVWVEEILETETDPNFTDEDGNTPLMIAVNYALDDNTHLEGWSEIVNALLEAGANPTLPSSQQRFFGNITTTPLAEAINTNSDHKVTIALIEEARYRLTYKDSDNDAFIIKNSYDKNHKVLHYFIEPSPPRRLIWDDISVRKIVF